MLTLLLCYNKLSFSFSLAADRAFALAVVKIFQLAMGRAPCCDKANVKKGPWSPEEDATLKRYLEQHGTGGNWIALPHKAGLFPNIILFLAFEKLLYPISCSLHVFSKSLLALSMILLCFRP